MNTSTEDYTVILFYKYTQIENPETLQKQQRKLCEKRGLTGRLIVAEEGVNATLEGRTADIENYISTMREDERFADIDFKKSPGNGGAFPELSVKVRPEIVSSRMSGEIDPTEDTAEHISPQTLHDWFESGEDFTVVDMRNDYELKSGKFEKTRHPDLRNFREIRDNLEEIDDLKDEKVVAVCTGGIRCEKATGFLKQEGFENVHQLAGGIHRYIEAYPDGYFRGSLYVFDGRMTVDFADGSVEPVDVCEYCEEPTTHYADDDSPARSRQFLCCRDCLEERSDYLRPAASAQSREVTAGKVAG